MAKNRKSKPAQETSTPSEEEIRAFIGYNSDYYLNAWHKGPQSGSASGFNSAGFIFSGMWLGYRKMYSKAIVVGCVGPAFFLLIGATMTLEEVIKLRTLVDILQSAIGIAIMLMVGSFGNRWYHAHTRRKVIEIRSTTAADRDVRLNKLADTGRTSFIGAFTVYIPSVLASPLICLLPLTDWYLNRFIPNFN